MPADKRADAACLAFLKGHLRLRPLQATGIGWIGLDGRLEDVSAAGLRRQIAFYSRWARAFQKLKRSAGERALDVAQLERLARFCLHLLKDRPEHGGSLELIFEAYETLTLQALRGRTPAAAADLLARLEAFPRFAAQVAANFERRRRSLPPDRRFLADAIASFRAMADDLAGGLPRQAGRRAPRLRPRLEIAGRRAASALRTLADRLESQVLPAAREAYALGPREYAWRLRHGLGVQEPLPRVQARGRRLLASIHREMGRVAARVEPRAGGRAGLRRLMRRLGAASPRDDRAVFALYRSLTDRARAFVAREDLFDVSPGYELKIIPTPAGLGASLTTAAYFVAPPLDPGLKGYFLVTPSRGDRARLGAHNRWHAASTAVHEAFPGHDMQYFLWQKMGARIPPWRYVNGDPKDWSTSMNIEGYAHYAEELMRRRGFYAPREELFQLAAQAWRAARIVVDIGLHSGTMRFEEAVRFLETEAFLDPATARGEAFRYSKWPTQALTYALGKLEIEALKERCRRNWGSSFTERRFHDRFLAFGPLPPSLIGRDLAP